jgi:hypothetical protein
MGKLLLPHFHAYRIDSNFFAGNYPGNTDPALARRKLRILTDAGVNELVNLMEESEMHWKGSTIQEYSSHLEDIAPAGALAMQRFPITDMHVPTVRFMQSILDHVDSQLRRGRTVYLHCLGGVGRTGTVVGCWIARHGIAAGDDALDELSRLREYDPMLDLPSPQTEEQCNMVREWEPGQ